MIALSVGRSLMRDIANRFLVISGQWDLQVAGRDTESLPFYVWLTGSYARKMKAGHRLATHAKHL